MKDEQAQVTEFYEQLLRSHGHAPTSLGWPTTEVQERNFHSVSQVFAHERRPFTVYEVGAGLGDMAGHLAAHHPFARYAGCDISAEMVAAAHRFHPELSIEQRDILHDPPERSDYLVTSGMFNVHRGADAAAWQNFVFAMLTAMFGCAVKGIAANFHTSYVDWRKPDDYYQDPLQLFDFAKRRLSKFVELRHAYYPWEYALLVYREPLAFPAQRK